jgi:UDP-N-acetylmuramoylalanine--D-glutamate ligase
MTTVERIRNRRIGVIGMARSGVAAALLARRLGGVVFVSDASARERLAVPITRLEEAGVGYEVGGHTEALFNSDFVVISPGVPLTAKIVTHLRERGIPIFSELEFASWVCKGTIVAITGSNGKTTTTTLVGEIFKAAGFETFVCGNIGSPFADIADRATEDAVVVAEVSTFQLETIETFAPHVAAILNVTPDHLDRHGTMGAYKQLKFRIAENQGQDDVLVLNADDAEVRNTELSTSAQVHWFSREATPAASVGVIDGVLSYRDGDEVTGVVPVAEIAIRGRHNLENALAAAAIVQPLKVAPETIAEVLRSFPGVEHRLEYVGRVAGINFINDSKATNVDSVVVALEAMNGGVHLIMGGRDKGAPYGPLEAAGRGKVRSLVAIGEAKERVFSELGKVFPTQFADSLEDAVRKCFESAFPGETVLLSPGCASFDMFEDFEHRGRAFKAVVAGLKSAKKKSNANTNG